MAVAASTILTKVRYEVQDADSDKYADAELLGYLSEGLRALAQMVAVKWPDYWLSTDQCKVDTQNVTSGTANYDLPADFYCEIQVALTDSDGDTALLDRIDFERTFDDDAGDVTGEYILRNDDIYLYPTPDASVTNGLSIYYVPQITDIATTATNVLLGDDWQDALKEYTVMKCKAVHEETAQDFAGFWQRLEANLESRMQRVNTSVHKHGIQTELRWWR